jgi:hypothetical protein
MAADFMEKVAATQQRLDEYVARFYRIQKHIEREEFRAARHRLGGFAEELELFLQELEMPVEMMLIGSQIGFFASKGSVARGRVPAALVGLGAGWLFGQSILARHRDEILDLMTGALAFEQLLAQEEELRDHLAAARAEAAGAP